MHSIIFGHLSPSHYWIGSVPCAVDTAGARLTAIVHVARLPVRGYNCTLTVQLNFTGTVCSAELHRRAIVAVHTVPGCVGLIQSVVN